MSFAETIRDRLLTISMMKGIDFKFHVSFEKIEKRNGALNVHMSGCDAIEADVPQRLRDLCADGALGRKAGRGLYPPEFYAR